MITSFESLLKNDLTDFLSVRKVALSKSAYEHTCHYLKKFDQYLLSCNCSIDELSESIIMGWLSTLKGKSSSIANEVIDVRIFLRYFKSIGGKAYIPPTPKVSDDYVPYVFSDEELNKIFEQADNIEVTIQQPNPLIQIEYPMVLRLMYGCGLRVSETLLLKMKDLDLDCGVLRMRHTKGNRERYVPMHKSLIIILKEYCLAMGLIGRIEAYLFPGVLTEVPITREVAYYRFKHILELSKISLPGRKIYQRGPCLHCLRHVFVFKSFAKTEKEGRILNDSVPYLSTYLGHDSLRETEKYLKFSSEMYPEAMELFESYTIQVFPEVNHEK